MSFTYTQTETVPTFGRLNLNSASLFLKTLFSDGRDRASLIFTSNNANNDEMTFGPSDEGSNLAADVNVEAPLFRVKNFTSNAGGVITTDATGLMTQSGDFTFDGSMLNVTNVTVSGNLTVRGTTTVVDVNNLLIEDPIVQVGMSNIIDSQDVGFIFTANTVSNVAMGYIPAASSSGTTDEFRIARTLGSADGTSLIVDDNSYINVHVYGNVIAGAFYGDGSNLTGVTASSTLQDVTTNGATTDVSTEFNGGLSATSASISGLLVLTGLEYQASASNILGYDSVTHTVFDTGYNPETNGNVFSTTIQAQDPNVSLVASGNVTVNGELVCLTNIIAQTITAEYSASINTLNANYAQIADLSVIGDNVNFYGPTVSISGNVTAASFTGDGSGLTNLSSTLQSVTAKGASSNQTITLTNATSSLVASGNVSLGGKLFLSGLDHVMAASNVLGYNPLTNEVFDTEVSTGSTSSNLQSIMLNGPTTNQTMYLSNVTTALVASSDIQGVDILASGNVVARTLTATHSAAINTLNANKAQISDLYVAGSNVHFYGPTVDMRGNLTAASLTTNAVTSNTVSSVRVEADVAKFDATLTNSLDVSGSATFNGVTTVSVLKFTPGGIDPALTAPTVSATVSGGLIQLNANGAVYGSNTLVSPGTISGFNVTNLNEGSHVYEYVKNVTMVTPTDTNTYLSTVTGVGINVMFHVFKVGGSVFIDSTLVNAV